MLTKPVRQHWKLETAADGFDRRDFFYCVALALAVVIFHRRVLFLNYVFPWDFRGVHVPLATFIADSFRRGEAPLWNPYTYCGIPLFADIQAALFYPPVFAAELAGAVLGTGFIPRLLAIAVVIQIIFAGLCTFALLRRMGARAGAAWSGALVYELGCYFAAQPEHMGGMHGATWLPLVWLCVVELRSQVRWRWVAILAVALAMTILAGLPMVAEGAFASAIALAILLALFELSSWRSAGAVLAGCIWALLVASIQFIPTAQYTQLSVAKYMTEWLPSGEGIPPAALLSLINPNHWSVLDASNYHAPIDITFAYFYSSVLGLVLAVAAVVWKPDRWAGVFSVLTVLAALAMMGDKTPLGRTVLLSVPARFRIGFQQQHWFFVFSLCLAVLAGLGADRFLRNTRLQLLTGVIIAADLILAGSSRPMNSVSLKAEPGFTPHSADSSVELVSRLRALTGATVPPSRFDTTSDVSYAWSTAGPLLGIPTANGCDPLAPERVIQVRLSFAPGPRWGRCYQVVNPASAIVGLANDRFLVTYRETRQPGYSLAFDGGWFHIYENPHWMPRFFVVNRVTAVRDLNAAARILHDPAFRPSEEAVVENDRDVSVSPAADTQVHVLSYSQNQWTVRVESSGKSLLVNTDTYYPGWEATVDGQPAPAYITDVAFRGILLPAGEHEIRMRFVPRILYWSAAISALALLAAVTAMLYRRDRFS